MQELLSKKPEQEKRLLSLLVNKLGDPDRKIGANVVFMLQQIIREHPGEYLSEGAAREWSTVVKIFIPPPSFKPVTLSLPRSPLFKTPKQVIFNPIHILTLLPHFSLIIIINLLLSF